MSDCDCTTASLPHVFAGDYGWVISVDAPDQDGSYSYLSGVTSVAFRFAGPTALATASGVGSVVAGSPPTVEYTVAQGDIPTAGVWVFAVTLAGPGWSLHAGTGRFRAVTPP